MPTKAQARCPCGQRATYRGRCPTCARRAEAARGSGGARGSTAKWQRFRLRYLRAHPRCVECGTTATDIDHMDGTGRTGSRAYDPTNLRAMCHPCHSERTARDQPGGWNRHRV